METSTDDSMCNVGNSHAVRRIMSESVLQNDESDGEKFDPYRVLERSQSDAALMHNHDHNSETTINISDEDNIRMRNIGHKVSECATVYFDLSKAVDSESKMKKSKNTSTSTRALETIPQDEELQIDKPIKNFTRSISSESAQSISSLSSFEESTYSQKVTEELSYFTSTVQYSKNVKGQEHSAKMKSTLKSSIQSYTQNLKEKLHILHIGSVTEQIFALRETLVIIENAWAVPVYGRDLAYSLCDTIRTEEALTRIVRNCGSSNKELLRASARVLEQIMTTENREAVANLGLETVVKMTYSMKGVCELARTTTGILESLFKTSEKTCGEVIRLGGLEVIIHWCRYTDRMTLRHCAFALANLALYGGPENQELMIKHKVPEWLFPLAFNDDDSIRYYACLAISALVSNKEIEAAVMNSGTMELVLPFIASHSPAEFAHSDQSHQHGHARGWLKRLIPVLASKREEAQALAAFHFAMEAGIKAEQDHKEIFYEIGSIEPLKRLASSPNATASKLAAEALKIIGEEVPHKLTQQVPLWSSDDVAYWVSQIGFSEYATKFKECRVDGDLLLMITEFDLQDSIRMSPSIVRKRFLRELKSLKVTADYSSCDISNLDHWLVDVSVDFSQYTYQMLRNGIDCNILSSVSEDELERECGISNSIHRRKMIQKIQTMRGSSAASSFDHTDFNGIFQRLKKTDVFISYRRSNGSQLASLLKVHLQLRGFSVFLDIERLRAGKFDVGLLNSVKKAKHFILVLTPQALDRCMGDNEKKDWVHKEIAAALENNCNIIPLMDNFDWPPVEKLPEDIRSISFFNGIRWIHDYQDACVDKLERFLRGELNSSRKGQLQAMSNQGSFEAPAASFRWSSSSSNGSSGGSDTPAVNVSPTSES